MDTLAELIYYCEEKEPVGALMLTGEWGCGKSYLINHGLKDALSGKAIIISVSLFGISSVEEIKNEVHKKWLFAYADSILPGEGNAEKATSVTKKLKGLLTKLSDKLPESIKQVTDSVLSVNIADFISIKNEIGNQKVILVFDDLERTLISTSDFLGCINDYCENQHFNTIVIAHEDKIKKDESKLSYKEIKEKIIQRTVKNIPDYPAIIENIVSNSKYKKAEYKTFLQQHLKEIVELFIGNDNYPMPDENYRRSYSAQREEEEEIRKILRKRPHNIRSIKCALQDFERVYDILLTNDVEEYERWLYSFTAFMLTFKAGLIIKSEYGLVEKALKILYPGYYNERYMLSGVKKWILTGSWDLDSINNEISRILAQREAIKPIDLLRHSRIMDLEEEEIEEAFPELQVLAYTGQLSLDEYVTFITNSAWAREFRLELPKTDWLKVQKGIQKQIDLLKSSGARPSHSRTVIGDESKKDFLEEEWNSYLVIHEFYSGDKLMFSNNQQLYIRSIADAPDTAFMKISNKRYNEFTVEMADATFQGYYSCKNNAKNDFWRSFISLWTTTTLSHEFNKNASLPGIQLLIRNLESSLDEYRNNNKLIAQKYTEDFIEKANELMHSWNQQSSEE